MRGADVERLHPMGAGAVIVVDTVTHLAWRRERDLSLHSTLALFMAAFSLAFVALRMAVVLAASASTSWR